MSLFRTQKNPQRLSLAGFLYLLHSHAADVSKKNYFLTAASAAALAASTAEPAAALAASAAAPAAAPAAAEAAAPAAAPASLAASTAEAAAAATGADASAAGAGATAGAGAGAGAGSSFLPQAAKAAAAIKAAKTIDLFISSILFVTGVWRDKGNKQFPEIVIAARLQ